MGDFVRTTITYSVPPADDVRAILTINHDPISGEQRERNFTRQTQEVEVENIRGREDTVSLDTAGFQFYTIPSKYKGEFLDDEEIKREYYPESEEVIKKLTGASKVAIFSHRIRRHKPGQVDGPGNRQPIPSAHIDQTPQSAIDIVHRHLPADEVPALLERRVQIINMWRPISIPALEWPLALCDFRSVDPKDVFLVTRFYAHRGGEAYSAQYNPNHKWKYVRGMTPDDIVLFKCSESIQDEKIAKYAVHAAFQDPTTPEGTPHRQSIEIRALVFYD